DEEGNQIYQTVEGREVVTNWGSQFQGDLKADGTGDRLNVIKTGITSAIVGEAVDSVGPGPVDLVTQDEEGTIIDGEGGDGINDDTFTEVDGEIVNADIIVAGAGGPAGVPDSVAYKVVTVPDGQATVAGRLDIRLDGEFVDLVNNSQPPLIDDPA